jgi:hypothetical protein
MAFFWRMVLFLAIFASVIIFVDPLRQWWWMTVIANRSFVSPFQWLDYAYCLIWLFEFMWSMVAGFLVALVMRSYASVSWALALAAVCGVMNFLLTHDHIGAEAPWIYPVWVYGTYLVPLLGAFIGAVLGSHMRAPQANAA